MAAIHKVKNAVGMLLVILTLSKAPLLEGSCNCFSIDGDVGAFFLLDSLACDIYGPILPAFTLEGTFSLAKNWSVWLDASYLFGNGSTDYGGANLNFIPLSLGLKCLYQPVQNIDLYLGVGPCYSFLIVKNYSPFLHERTTSNNAGVIVKSGFIYHHPSSLFFDGFINYIGQQFSFDQPSTAPLVYSRSASLNGIELGIGLGYRF